jgi:SAM-dependent methyltransferase
MTLRHLRLRAFYAMLSFVQPHLRKKRMRLLELLELEPGSRVLDLGGTTSIWQHVSTPLEITIVNLPGVDVTEDVSSHHTFTFIEGDATRLDFSNYSFDLVFSNSVIEHVGLEEKRTAFAHEVRRLAPRYYIQTPSIYFPLEPHTGIPFWWGMPNALRQRFIRRWKKKLPAWTAMIEGTCVIRKKEFSSYFPDADVRTERFMGCPKSYIALRFAGR